MNNNLSGQPLKNWEFSICPRNQPFRNDLTEQYLLVLVNFPNVKLNVAFNKLSGSLPESLGNATHQNS